MTKTLKLTLALVLGLSAGSVFAQARTPAQLDSYVYDTRDTVWKSGTNLCWRTARWTPAGAVKECDPDLISSVERKTYTPVEQPVEQAVVPEVKQEKINLQAETLFDFDKYFLRPAGKAALDELASKMELIDLELIIATGHTDSIGTDAYNMALSFRRANAVKAYLVSKGIDAERIKVDGRGKREPIATNKTREGRQLNRRVEIVVYGNQR